MLQDLIVPVHEAPDVLFYLEAASNNFTDDVEKLSQQLRIASFFSEDPFMIHATPILTDDYKEFKPNPSLYYYTFPIKTKDDTQMGIIQDENALIAVKKSGRYDTFDNQSKLEYWCQKLSNKESEADIVCPTNVLNVDKIEDEFREFTKTNPNSTQAERALFMLDARGRNMAEQERSIEVCRATTQEWWDKCEKSNIVKGPFSSTMVRGIAALHDPKENDPSWDENMTRYMLDRRICKEKFLKSGQGSNFSLGTNSLNDSQTK